MGSSCLATATLLFPQQLMFWVWNGPLSPSLSSLFLQVCTRSSGFSVTSWMSFTSVPSDCWAQGS